MNKIKTKQRETFIKLFNLAKEQGLESHRMRRKLGAGQLVRLSRQRQEKIISAVEYTKENFK